MYTFFSVVPKKKRKKKRTTRNCFSKFRFRHRIDYSTFRLFLPFSFPLSHLFSISTCSFFSFHLHTIAFSRRDAIFFLKSYFFVLKPPKAMCLIFRCLFGVKNGSIILNNTLSLCFRAKENDRIFGCTGKKQFK